MIYLGSHVSFKAPNYFKGAIEEAISYGANACMIYTGPPSNTRRVDVSKLKIEEAKDYMAKHNFSIDRVIVHAPYIINLANALKPETAQFGQDFLKTELERVSKIGAKTLVLHPGSHVGLGIDTGIENIINIFEPEVICIGGSFVYYKDILLEKLKNKLKEKNAIFNDGNIPDIVCAKLKNDAGIIGATL